jgi:polyhydroxyalkanoate synthesis regulator phasin
MSFASTWSGLLAECEALEDDATLITPLSEQRFRITDVQEHCVIIEFVDSEESRPLQREQFETLVGRVQDGIAEFELDRLPPEADPYPAVLSLHPRFEIDKQAGTLSETDDPTPSQLIQGGSPNSDEKRTEPDLAVYSDALLLVDALERYDVSELEELETASLINLYTLLSDAQRDADDLRGDVADVLLDRVYHDQPVHGQFGSVQRTGRTYRSLRDEDEVLETLGDAGIPRERVTSVDSAKVDEALEVTEVAPTDVYEIEEREYVRKAEVDEEEKETRLQGLKDRLAATEGDEAEELREEIEELERRINDLTSFRSGAEV